MQINVNITNDRYFPEDAGKKTRVYVQWAGENMLDDLINRTSRPHSQVKPLVALVLAEAGIDTTGMTWSQRAGCSCGCSPGFTLPNGPRGHAIWVKIEGVPSVTADSAEREARAAAFGVPVV